MIHIKIVHAVALLFFMSMLYSEVSAQCSDPLIYKLTDIQQLITNLTAKQERQEEQIQTLEFKHWVTLV